MLALYKSDYYLLLLFAPIFSKKKFVGEWEGDKPPTRRRASTVPFFISSVAAGLFVTCLSVHQHDNS